MADDRTGPVRTEDIERLVRLFDESDWDELHLVVPGLEIFLSNDPGARVPGAGATDCEAAPPQPAAAAAAPAAGVAPAGRVPEGMAAVRAPNLGTFYRAPKPGAPAYVEIGQRVDADTEICLIEVMKLFTAVRAGIAGVVREIRVEDGQMVESGQVLAVIEPAV